MASLVPSNRSKRVLPHVLAAAMLHFLGACPCGCLDGNLWLQQVLSVVESDDYRDTGPQPVAWDHHCDHDLLAWLVDGVHDAAERMADAQTALSPGENVGAAVVRVSQVAGEAFPTETDGRSARSLRAALQIFLI